MGLEVVEDSDSTLPDALLSAPTVLQATRERVVSAVAGSGGTGSIFLGNGSEEDLEGSLNSSSSESSQALARLSYWRRFRRACDALEVPTLARLELFVTTTNVLGIWLAGLNGMPFEVGQSKVGDFNVVAVAIACCVSCIKISLCALLLMPPGRLMPAKVQSCVDVITTMTAVNLSTSVTWAVIELMNRSQGILGSMSLIQLVALVTMASANILAAGVCILVEQNRQRLYSFDSKPVAECNDWLSFPREAYSEFSEENRSFCTTCSICLDDFAGESEVVQLPCRHLLHIECATDWLTKGGRCPFRCTEWSRPAPASHANILTELDSTV